MTFSVSDFAANLSRGGIAKSSHFDIQFTAPKGLLESSANLRDLSIRCDSVSLPNRASASTPIKYYGNVKKHYYGTIDPTPITVTIILSENLKERDLFLSWQDIALGKIRKPFNAPRLGNFNVGYYADYVSNINIRKFNEAGKLVMITKLVEAYPSIVGEGAMSWSDESIMRLNVTFDYYYFQETYPGSENETELGRNRILNNINRRRFTGTEVTPF